jgi:hypothetical protein
MLILSLITQIGIIAAYLLNGRMPFSSPISLLGDRYERIPYHAVLGLLLVAWAWYLLHCWRARMGIEMILTGLVGLLIMALQCQANEDSGHDAIAITAMIAVSLLTIRISCRLADTAAMAVALASFASCSLVVSGNLLIVGVAENLVLSAALALLTWDCRATRVAYAHAHAVRTGTGPYAANGGPAHWPAGVAAGLTWALVCLLITAISCGCDGNWAGPMVVAVSWCGGYAAWRDDQPSWLRAGLLGGSAIASLVAFSLLSHHHLGFTSMLMATFLVLWILLLVLIFDLHAPPA